MVYCFPKQQKEQPVIQLINYRIAERFFVDPGEEVYAGQIIAEHIKPGDLVVNATEAKKLTNHRASGS